MARFKVQKREAPLALMINLRSRNQDDIILWVKEAAQRADLSYAEIVCQAIRYAMAEEEK